MEMVNGYVFLDLTKSNVYSKALKVLGTDKPVVIKDGSGAPYFVDSLTLDGTSVVITKGGKTITIANDNTITNEGLVANPTMENIVDLNGNKRFIEDDGTPAEITGVTPTYCKWSLSGTHLMLVYAGNVADTSTISAGITFASFTLPKYIFDKIYPVFATNRLIYGELTLYADDWSTQKLGYTIDKGTYAMQIITQANLTLTKDRAFRFQFDLLIDAE